MSSVTVVYASKKPHRYCRRPTMVNSRILIECTEVEFGMAFVVTSDRSIAQACRGEVRKSVAQLDQEL